MSKNVKLIYIMFNETYSDSLEDLANKVFLEF